MASSFPSWANDSKEEEEEEEKEERYLETK